jgi:hypothetical protein
MLVEMILFMSFRQTQMEVRPHSQGTDKQIAARDQNPNVFSC